MGEQVTIAGGQSAGRSYSERSRLALAIKSSQLAKTSGKAALFFVKPLLQINYHIQNNIHLSHPIAK